MEDLKKLTKEELIKKVQELEGKKETSKKMNQTIINLTPIIIAFIVYCYWVLCLLLCFSLL